MERKMYELTERQIEKARRAHFEMPSDDEIKARWAKRHGGKVSGWGMLKRDLALAQLKGDIEYQRGLWQGRVDKARGVPYSEERNENSFNLGYYIGYTEYESNRCGWDQATRDEFDEKYLSD